MSPIGFRNLRYRNWGLTIVRLCLLSPHPSYKVIRESFALISESFAFIRESFAFIRESYALIREK